MRGVRDAIFTKMKQSGKNVELNKEVLGAELKQVEQHIYYWSSSYQRRNHRDEPRVGEDILDNLYGVVNVTGYYLSHLQYSNDRNKTNFKRES